MKGCIPALLLILLTACFSCSENKTSSGNSEDAAHAFNGSEKQDSLVFKRFEKDLFGISDSTYQADTTRLRSVYGSFMDLYFSQVIKIGNPGNPMFQQNLNGFLNDPDIRSVYSEITKQFPDLSDEKSRLEGAFSNYRHYFPDSIIPAVYTILSGFSYNIVTADSALGIGLDMYLGEESRFYDLLGFPKYRSAQMRRERIVPDAIRAFLLSSWEMQDQYHDLVTRMIYHGRILYLSSLLLPELSEAELLGYSDKQWEWCKNHEAMIWGHFIDRKLFYSTDFNDEVAYINDGPFSKGFPQEAPPRIGVWLGLQLIKSYMEKGGQTVPELMWEKDARKIFSNSKYKPGRA